MSCWSVFNSLNFSLNLYSELFAIFYKNLISCCSSKRTFLWDLCHQEFLLINHLSSNFSHYNQDPPNIFLDFIAIHTFWNGIPCWLRGFDVFNPETLNISLPKPASMGTTQSPGLRDVTSLPTSITSPTPSFPPTAGRGHKIGYEPMETRPMICYSQFSVFSLQHFKD